MADKLCHLQQFCIVNLKYCAMKIITIEEEAWKQLNNRISSIADYLKSLNEPDYDNLWLNNHEVCQYLHISEKTLWRMRTKGEISYSKIYGQYFYTLGTIKDMLNANAVQSSDEYVLELMDKAKSYIAKGRKLKDK
ncbi:DNA-binding protein [Elizabethkingia meningoseptica]|nr:DNA-binding protein [Elizabethkingia meningoseptica]